MPPSLWRLSALALLLLTCPASWAAEPTILPKEGMYVGIVRVETESGWACLSQNFDPVELVLIEGSDETGYRTCAVHGPAGKYAVLQINGFKVTTHKVTLGKPGPKPVDPVDPDPVDPVDPVDPIHPAPIKAAGFRVLVLYEAKKPLPGEQNLIPTSEEIRSYLTSKCAKEGGVIPSFRFWDDDYTVANFDAGSSPDYLRDAYLEVKAKKPDDEPWIVISNGTNGEVVPLPKTIVETMSLLRKWGG